MSGSSRSGRISTKQQQIANLSREMPEAVLTTLSHHMDLDWLEEARKRTRKDGAVGVDGGTAQSYEEDLEGNLQSLLDRAKSGIYRAPPVRRVYIPKGRGKTRPLGIPTYEDKVLQRAVVMLLEPVYETSFLDVSYGFRPGRSAHQALESTWKQLMTTNVGWVLDVDIQGFFDHLDHTHLRAILRQRVGDGVVLRLIDKWLNAGVLEEGTLKRALEGTPQGGVISPLLANIYLHEVLDQWYACEVKPRMRGNAFMVRYADDVVMGFERKDDADRVLKVLEQRLGRFGLTLHPEKTRLVRFRRPRRWASGPTEEGPGTFSFLGFTHYWGKSRRGSWVVRRKTQASRFARAVRQMSQWMRGVRSQPVRKQHAKLQKKVKGHYAYYGITGNWEALNRFCWETCRLWKKWLSRRSQRAAMSWTKFRRLLETYPLPPARVVHSTYRRTANA